MASAVAEFSFFPLLPYYFRDQILPQKRSAWHTGGGGCESSAPYLNGNGRTCQGASLGREEENVNSINNDNRE